MTLTELRANLKNINLEEEGVEIMIEHSDTIIALNQKQLVENTGVDGYDLPRLKSEQYIEEKALTRFPSSYYNMYWSGRSFSTMFLSFSGYEYIIRSSGEAQNWHDSTSEEYRKYLEPFIILGLTEEHKEYYRHSSFLPTLVDRINKAIK